MSILLTQFSLSKNEGVFLVLSLERQPQEPVLGKTVRVLDVEWHEQAQPLAPWVLVHQLLPHKVHYVSQAFVGFEAITDDRLDF